MSTETPPGPEIPQPPATPLRCFVIMPFAATRHKMGDAEVSISEDQWTHIFKEWIKKAVESFPDKPIVCKRSPAKPGNFVKGIVQDIEGSDLVVADLTGNRPNVYYELGIRHALRTGTLIITQDLKALPADLHSYYCFEYGYAEKSHEYQSAFTDFAKELHEKIRFVLNDNYPSDNPVSDFLGFKRFSAIVTFTENKDRVTNALVMVDGMLQHCLVNMKALSSEAGSHVTIRTMMTALCDKELIDAVFLRLLLDGTLDCFPAGWTAELLSYLQDVRRVFRLIEAKSLFFNVGGANDKERLEAAQIHLNIVGNVITKKQLSNLIQAMDAFTEPARHI